MNNFVKIPIYYDPADKVDITAIYGFVPFDKWITEDIYILKQPSAFGTQSETTSTGETVKVTVIYVDGNSFCTPKSITELLIMFSNKELINAN